MPRTPAIPAHPIDHHILLVRGQKVILDRDLANLYGVKPIALRQQIKRNPRHFPADFMFRLTQEEVESLVSQSVIPSRRSLGGFLPYAFTQEGIAMLSSVLRSARAVQMNILIMRTFARLREVLAANKDLAARIEKLEAGQRQPGSIIGGLVDEIDGIAREIKGMKALPEPPGRKIGFRLS